MTKKKNPAGTSVPQLRRHKRSKRAYARFNGHETWFGPWTNPSRDADPETRAAFDAYLAQWLARGRKAEDAPEAVGLTVRTLAARYLRHLEAKKGADWISKKNGNRIPYALDALTNLYGCELAAEFGPLKLDAVRQALIVPGRLCRSEINARVSKVKATFKWAAGKELVPAAVSHALEAVEPLEPGDFETRDNKPRGDVPWAVVEKTLPFIPKPLDTVVRLLWLTGARPSEVLRLVAGDIDRSDPEQWVAVVVEHKTAHRTTAPRVLVFEQQAQRLLMPFLMRRADTLLFPGRAGAYDHRALRQAVRRACQRAGVAPWSPYQIRHSAATDIANKVGQDAAKTHLGHASGAVTKRYIHEDAVAKAKAASAQRHAAG